MVKAKFSKNYEAVRSRVRRLPRLMIGQMRTRAKRDANGVIEKFREGIRDDELRLRRLRPATVRRKDLRGFEAPSTPLYGLGPADKRSYSNMLHAVNVGDRLYAVRPKPGFHHGKRFPGDPDPRKKAIKLKDLFDVHEYGAVISNAFGKGITVRIPPRPALRYAHNAYMRERAKADPAVEVRAAIAKFVQAGNAEALERIRRKLERAGAAGGKP